MFTYYFRFKHNNNHLVNCNCKFRYLFVQVSLTVYFEDKHVFLTASIGFLDLLQIPSLYLFNVHRKYKNLVRKTLRRTMRTKDINAIDHKGAL